MDSQFRKYQMRAGGYAWNNLDPACNKGSFKGIVLRANDVNSDILNDFRMAYLTFLLLT